MKQLLPALIALTALCLTLAGCGKHAEETTVSYQFSVDAPEFLKVTPEESFKLFASVVAPNLSAKTLLQKAESGAPQEVRNMIQKWMPDTNCIIASQFGQNQINFLMLAPGSGNSSLDKRFCEHMQKSITEQARTALAYATTKAEPGGAANRSQPVQLGTNSAPLPAGSAR
jgi:hypothetical protein